MPLSAKLVFFLKSVVPQKFPRDQAVEVAAADGSFHTVLSLSDGSLVLEDARTALGTLEPHARFGASAFGPIRARAVSAEGVPGEWLPIGTLVRLPGFRELRCPRSTAKPCLLSAGNLFLASSIASSQDFSNSTEIPPDFTGTQIQVPHPASGVLYLKLRDDPDTVQTLTLPVLPLPVSTNSTAVAAEPSPSATGAPQGASAAATAASPDPTSTPKAQH